MPDNPLAKPVRILIASPSDVTAERDIAERVISRLHLTDINNHPLVLEAGRWEFDVPADIRKPAQDTVNDWLVNACDCAVCIFWSRIGTKTDNAKGGAVEELERMLSAGKPVLLYFSEAGPNSIMDIDSLQLHELSEWRKRLREEKRLSKSYKNSDSFGLVLKDDLELLLKREFCGGSRRMAVSLPPDVQQAEEKYRLKLQHELGTVSLLGSSVIQPFPLRLKDIFVPLDMYDNSGGEQAKERCVVGDVGQEMASHRPGHVMKESFRKCSTMLVIGDPGSGKTTLMKYYALTCLDENPPESLGFSEPVRVFYLPLREIQHRMSLPANLSSWSERNYLTITTDTFESWLDGGVSLVLLDGLDEVSDPKERKAVCRWIEKMNGAFGRAKFVVTSRPTAYGREEGIVLDLGHQPVLVRDFSHSQQEAFLENWYKAALLHDISPEGCSREAWEEERQGEAKKLTETMVCYLKKPENRGIRELAAIPMLLQIMAILWKERRFLPGRRQDLYSAALDYLLDYRDRAREQEPRLTAEEARRVLAPVALWMQETLGSDEADRRILQLKMQETLDGIRQPHTVEEICRNLVDRAGVLVEHGKATYVFRHKTFREFLAAVQLKEEWFEAGRLEMIVGHFGEESGWWDEVIRFLMGQSNAKLFDRFMNTLFASSASNDFSPKQKTLLEQVVEESPEQCADALCGSLLNKAGISAGRQRALLETLKAVNQPKTLDALRAFMAQGLALNDDISELAEDVILFVGRASGVAPAKVTGAPEVAVSLNDRPAIVRNQYELDARYILIPGGKYIYSVTEKEVSVPDLWFARYPVTNRQYRSFIGFLAGKPAEGIGKLSLNEYTQALHDLAHSGEDTLKGFDAYLKGGSDLVKRFASGADDDRKFNKDEQPVVTVTFFDARAYCLWLSMLSGVEYRLPTEQEWEWAAGGRREEPGNVLKVKRYPWGDKPEPTPKHANFGRNEGATTPVGRYPDGATPEGLYDMAGNVWEWMGNWYSDQKSAVSLRGGSWYYLSEDLRCRARDDVIPGVSDNYGFRVVCPSPVF